MATVAAIPQCTLLDPNTARGRRPSTRCPSTRCRCRIARRWASPSHRLHSPFRGMHRHGVDASVGMGVGSARGRCIASASPSSGDGDMCRDKISANLNAKGDASGEDMGAQNGDGPRMLRVTFKGAENSSVTITCPDDTYILDAAIEHGLELPFSCRGGICGSCVGRVSKGKVDQTDIADLSFTLEDEEIEQGMALICMARPLSDEVEIETQSDWGYSLGIKEWEGATGFIQGKEVNPLSNENIG
mmetsp:Transcript_1963/g.4462  ORF Transcript_1963/g.4462 Transcript_1963/m.4462 type:complete len:245 (-) Transcript_1963:68-802(-)